MNRLFATSFPWWHALCVLGWLLAISSQAAAPAAGLFARSNLVAWCIVPFDAKKRGPEERAQMLRNLGLRRLAYDWRAEHTPSFDADVDHDEAASAGLEPEWHGQERR